MALQLQGQCQARFSSFDEQFGSFLDDVAEISAEVPSNAAKLECKHLKGVLVHRLNYSSVLEARERFRRVQGTVTLAVLEGLCQ